jgi:hypothetical protein
MRDLNTRELAALAFALIAACLVAACSLILNPPGAEIVVVNDTTGEYVVEVVDPYGTRYYAIARNSVVLIDTVADANPPPDAVTLLDDVCRVVRQVHGEFAGGGVVSIQADGAPTFTPGRPGGGHADRPSDQFTGEPTCQAAAGALQKPVPTEADRSRNTTVGHRRNGALIS